MTKEEVVNAMLDGLVNGLNVQRNALSRLSKINELMPLMKTKSYLVKIESDSSKAITYSEGFLDGYESRINSVWHDRSEEPDKEFKIIVLFKDKSVLIIGERARETKWSEFIERIRLVKWAYIKDLIPSEEE